MPNLLNGIWQVSAPAGTQYSNFFQSLANVASQTLSGDATSYTVVYLDGTSIVYGGSGLSYNSGSETLNGTITSVTVRDAGATTIATMTSALGNQFRIDGGAAIHSAASFYDLLLSGNNLIIGSNAGTSGNPELLDGGTGSDTFRPGNAYVTLNDIVGASTLDVSLLTGPVTVNLALQTFTANGATGTMNGVSRVLGSDGQDSITGGIDGEFVVRTGDGNDTIEAVGQSLYGGQFEVNAGAGDDLVLINQFGYGALHGGDGHDTLRGGGDLRYYTFQSFETLENTNFLQVRIAQLQVLDEITDLNAFNGDTVVFQLYGSGTVDFAGLMAAGLGVNAVSNDAGANLNGTAQDDTFQDSSNGLIGGVPVASVFFGAGGNDTIFNNSGNAMAAFSGNVADYTLAPGGGLAPPWIITDNRLNSPDGTDTLFYFNSTEPLLKFRDHTLSIDEFFALQADPQDLPAQIYNGVLELLGPDGFDYTTMLPALSRATGGTLAGTTTYTVDYQGGIRVVFTGTGLSVSGALTPSGGSVTGIEVFDTSIPGQVIPLARISSDAGNDHLFRVPFTEDLLQGGSRLFYKLMSGNNEVIVGVNDDVIPMTEGFDRVTGTSSGYDTVYFGPQFVSIEYTPDTQDGIGGTFNYVDFPSETILEITFAAADDVRNRANNGEDIVNRPLPSLIKAIIAHFGGDPHVQTLDGLNYSFHALGEFVLSRSTVPGDTFEIQARTIPFPVVGMASVVEQTATRVGSDIVTFDASRANVVLINGLIADFSSGPITLDGGVLSQNGQGNWSIAYETGETFSVSHVITGTPFLTLTLDAGDQRAAGTLEGIWGNYDSLTSNEFQLDDGTVLARPLSRNVLYSTFANEWRVTDQTTLLDYDLGEDTDTFTNTGEPRQLNIADFPPEVVEAAEALVNAAGIDDPALRLNAIYDYLLTGDTTYIASYAALSSRGIITAEVEATSGGTAKPLYGIIAQDGSTIEAETGNATEVSFVIYRAGPAVGAAVIDWAAVSPGAGYFQANDFTGGVLPSGQVTFATGESRKTITVSLVDGAVTAALERVKIEITPAGSEEILAPSAIADVVSNAPASADAADAQFVKIGGPGALTHTGNAYTIALGTIDENTAVADIEMGVLNAALRGANDISGLFSEAGSSQIDFSGLDALLGLDAGQLQRGIFADIDTSQPGSFTRVLTLEGFETNATGYAAAHSPRTLTVTITVRDIVDTVLGTSSSETLTGDNGVENILARSGNDIVRANGGNDVVRGEGGNDTLYGGAGNDRIYGDSGNDTIRGEDGLDQLYGSSGNDKIYGGNHADKIFGESGLDVLYGDAGNDTITGGSGRDTMYGGTGSDDFVYKFASEAGRGSTRDVIKDFTARLDDIDLRAIDANGSAAGSAAFKFLAAEGAAFTGVRGQLRWDQQGSRTLIEGDIDGNRVADFQIELTGLTKLTAGDFLL